MPKRNPHPLFDTWVNMRSRCSNQNNPQWAEYGGRGIGICERWSSFDAFAEDMGERPDKHVLDRADRNADYSPENCKWVSRREQKAARGMMATVVIDGQVFLAKELAERIGIEASTIRNRAKIGISGRDLLSDTPRKKSKFTKTHCVHGHEYTEENTIINSYGARLCRSCVRAAEQKRKAEGVGLRHNPLYRMWANMRERTSNPNNKNWPQYGGRGIYCCPEWTSFIQFTNDMGDRPEGYTLDRIDNDGPYSPQNCRWASVKEQSRNRRNTAFVTIEGIQYKAIDLADQYGIDRNTIYYRCKKGMTFAEVTQKERFAPGRKKP